MIRKLKNIFLLYLREPGFVILCILSFLSLCAMQALIYWGIQKNLWNDNFASISLGHQKTLEILIHKYMLGDELLSLVFILGLWLMFSFGLLIKRQFANERASLMPGYHPAHALGMIFILGTMVSTTIVMSKSTMQLSQLFFLQALNVSASLWAIYLVILGMALFMLYLGYLSMGYIVVLGYIALVIIGQNIVALLQFFSSSPSACGSATAVLILMFILFVRRLLNLKSEHTEYPFLLAWPPQKAMRNQAALEEKIDTFKKHFLKILHISPKVKIIRPYFRLKNIWQKANHWRNLSSSIFSLLYCSLLGLPLYFVFLKSPAAEFITNAKPESNFLLLSGAAVLLTGITHYKNMVFYSYDLLKPVTRKNFFKEQGLKVFQDLCVFWLVIVLYFAFAPDWAEGSKQICQPHFWVYMFLTFSFSMFCLVWLATLSAMKDERAVVGNGFVLCVIILAEFYLGSKAPTIWLIINALLCLILAGLFLKLAFEKWMDVEF